MACPKFQKLAFMCQPLFVPEDTELLQPMYVWKSVLEGVTFASGPAAMVPSVCTAQAPGELMDEGRGLRTHPTPGTRPAGLPSPLGSALHPEAAQSRWLPLPAESCGKILMK